MTFSSNGLLATASADGTAKLWSCESYGAWGQMGVMCLQDGGPSYNLVYKPHDAMNTIAIYSYIYHKP